jgi:hypothetical protein
MKNGPAVGIVESRNFFPGIIGEVGNLRDQYIPSLLARIPHPAENSRTNALRLVYLISAMS